MKKRFHKVNVEISNICNLQCSFCPEVVRAKKIMSVDLFKKIIEQIAPLTDQVCLHLMGEPLAHPKLKELITLCEQAQVKIFFVSNGVLLKEETFDLLLNKSFRQINFSLHSFFDNYPDKNPENYLRKVFNFTEKAFLIRPDLYINYRLWNLNDPRGTKTNNQTMLNSIFEHFQIQKTNTNVDVRTQKSFLIKNRLYLHYDTEFTWPNLDLPLLGTKGTCYGLSSHFGILADGTVVPCCLDKEGDIPLGNVEQQSIKEILSSEKATQILNGFKSNKLIDPLCQRCQYIERFK